MEKIIFLDAGTVGNLPEVEALKKLGKLDLYEQSTYNETEERVKFCTILLTNKVVVDRHIIDSAPFLKLICVTATGVNNVDTAYASSKGITIKNVKGYSTDSVAQVAFGSILFLINQISYFDQYVKSGSYSKSKNFTNITQPFWQLAGKTFGIIGLGTIGKQVAKIASAFGAKVVFYSTSGNNSHPIYERLPLEKLLQKSHVVSIHAPLNDDTKNLINYSNLQLMLPSAILVNTGRGGIVNEFDLAKALNENLIQGAALDVMDQEPLASDHPLLNLMYPHKLLLTPHIAWASIESRSELMKLTFMNIENFLNNGA